MQFRAFAHTIYSTKIRHSISGNFIKCSIWTKFKTDGTATRNRPTKKKAI